MQKRLTAILFFEADRTLLRSSSGNRADTGPREQTVFDDGRCTSHGSKCANNNNAAISAIIIAAQAKKVNLQIIGKVILCRTSIATRIAGARYQRYTLLQCFY